MRNFYKIGFALTLLLMITQMNAQVEYRLLDGFGTRMASINSGGKAVAPGQYYDYATNTFTSMESGVTTLSSINDLGHYSGHIDLAEDGSTTQPGFKVGDAWEGTGWWSGSDPENSSFTTYTISSNGKYVSGQMSESWVEFWGFVYDTETGVLSKLSSDSYEYGAAYAVNSNGYAVGWVDHPDGGTQRMACYYTPTGEIHIIGVSDGTVYSEANGINDNNVVTGVYGGVGFTYDIDNDELVLTELPEGAESTALVAISDNGIAVGYAAVGWQVRDAILYHPNLGNTPIYVKDFLADHGITDLEVTDGLLGTGYTISADGNWVGGWINGTVFLANGWVVFIDDLLIGESECTLVCPQNIVVSSELGETSVNVEYELTFECIDPDAEVEIILIEGLPSGSDFPIGSTYVFHQLVNEAGDVLSSCSFTVTVEDSYCVPVVEYVEPITYVNFEGIDNRTSASFSSPANEYFLDQVATVSPGQNYIITLEGNTSGNYVNYFTVFVDWNNDGVFSGTDEIFPLGTITNSTGEDGIQLIENIEIPAGISFGEKRMRILKNYDYSPTEPCGSYFFGQSEDYTLNVVDTYCVPVYTWVVEPITYVNFAGIDNTTSASTDSAPNEYFLDQVATVNIGEVYEITLKGNTDGDWTNYFTAFIDLNQDGDFEDAGEVISLGSITNSTGEDDVQLVASITIPEGALGETRLRIVKNFGSSPADACGTYAYGQSEDYTIILEPELSVGEVTIKDLEVYPNPVKDVLYIRGIKSIDSVELTNLAGQKVLGTTIRSTEGQVNVSGLTSGVYVLKAIIDGETKTIKVIKK